MFFDIIRDRKRKRKYKNIYIKSRNTMSNFIFGFFGIAEQQPKLKLQTFIKSRKLTWYLY